MSRITHGPSAPAAAESAPATSRTGGGGACSRQRVGQRGRRAGRGHTGVWGRSSQRRGPGRGAQGAGCARVREEG
eukprot:6724557-Prymnesium_polylepis.1